MDQQQPQQPQWNPPPAEPQPPQQPQWTPPPQQPMGWGGPGYGGPPPRPIGVTLASIFLIVLGAFLVLTGLLVFLGTAAFSQYLGDAYAGPFVAAFGAFFGIIILIWAVLHLLGGIGAIQGKGWGRWTGIVVAVISLIFFIFGVLGSLGGGTSGRTDTGGLVFEIVFIVLYALTAWALIQASSYFAWRR
jgi:hypothetical protein